MVVDGQWDLAEAEHQFLKHTQLFNLFKKPRVDGPQTSLQK